MLLGYLNDNKLEKIDGLKCLNNLKLLFLAENQLKLIDLKILIDLTQLTYLYIENNRISAIIGSSFPLNLKFLNLTNNKLRSLDVRMLKDLNQLEKVFLNDNNFNKETETGLRNQLKNIKEINFTYEKSFFDLTCVLL